MGALNLPSAADIDKLTRRLRTVGTRLEGIEEALDRVQEGVDRLSEQLDSAGRGVELGDRLAAVEGQLAKLVAETLDSRPAPLPREQQRLAVDEAPPKPARKRAAKKKA